MSYCTQCPIRNEKKFRNKKGEIDFSDLPIRSIQTNVSSFCYAGYTQNPNTLEATENVLKNGGTVCKNNPFIHDMLKKDSFRLKLQALKRNRNEPSKLNR